MPLDMLWQVLTLLLLMGVGYVARKAGVLNASLQRGISNLVLSVALPAAIVAASQQMNADDGSAGILTVLAGALLYFAGTIAAMELSTRWLPLDRPRKAALRLLTIFPNCSFIGFPILRVLMPEQGVFYGSFFILVFHFVIFTYGVAITGGREGVSFKSIALNMNNIASVIMVLLFLFGVRLPAPLGQGLELLGGLCTPLSMLVIGCMLAGVEFKRIFTSPLVYVASFLRLLLVPSLVFVILRALGIGGVAGTVVLILSGMPCSGIAAMQAEKNNCAPETMANGVMLSTLLFLPSIFYLMFLQSML